MEKTFVLLLLLLGIWFAAPAQSTVPDLINYQGYLSDTAGNPVPDGTYSMVFTLNTTEDGDTGVWGQTSSAVSIVDGIINVELGPFTYPEQIFDGDLFLEIEVNGEVLTPRQRLGSAAFARRAEVAEAVINGVISTVHLIDGTVTRVKVADDAITSAKIADESVTADDIVDGAGSDLDADTLDGLDATDFVSATEFQVAIQNLQNQIAVLQSENQVLKDKLEYVTVVEGAVNGLNGPHMVITGANLHVRSGSGMTNGAVNGSGNLIIGYDEPREWYSCSLGLHFDETRCVDLGGKWWVSEKSGSHNLVVGGGHNYSSLGGIVVGVYNTISGIYATVTGGNRNTASGYDSSVSGGASNTAFGDYSSVSGGTNNRASYFHSSVSGGSNNIAGGYASSVSGGFNNTAISYNYSSVSGGSNNTARGRSSSVSGGSSNTANGDYSSVNGGSYNKASGEYSFVGGGGGLEAGMGNEAFAELSSILGGVNNVTGDPGSSDETIGSRSTISGGYGNKTTGWDSTVSGGSYNHASGAESSVNAGYSNTASGIRASVNGGSSNRAFSNYSSILGGSENTAGDDTDSSHTSGVYATVSGGWRNPARGDHSSVLGGNHNPADGEWFSNIGDIDRIYYNGVLIPIP